MSKLAEIERETIFNDRFRRELFSNPDVVGRQHGLSDSEIDQLRLRGEEHYKQLAHMLDTDGANKL